MIRYHWELDVYKLSVEASMEMSASIHRGWKRSDERLIGASASSPAYDTRTSKAGEDAGAPVHGERSSLRIIRDEMMTRTQGKKLHKIYDQIIGKLVTMGNQPETFLLSETAKTATRDHSPASSPPHSR